MESMVDWSLASTVSRGVAKLAPAGDPAPFQAVEGPNAESERLVSAYTGLEPITPLPAPEAVGRDEWIDANLSSMRGVLAHVADQLEADHDQLLRWVSLHETTHALQFGGVPWLRAHIAESVGGLLGSLTVDAKGLLRMPDTSDLRALVDNVREG